MKETGLLMQGWGVRAILDGRKTQSRRVIVPQPLDVITDGKYPTREIDGRRCWCAQYENSPPRGKMIYCRYGQPGDRLWIRETWRLTQWGGEEPLIQYKADGSTAMLGIPEEWWDRHPGLQHLKWRPSIHMPRWASRLNPPLVSVRVERVQDIKCGGYMFRSEVQKEGCPFDNDPSQFGYDELAWFISAWDTINAKRGYSWETNPYVWVLEYKVEEDK